MPYCCVGKGWNDEGCGLKSRDQHEVFKKIDPRVYECLSCGRQYGAGPWIGFLTENEYTFREANPEKFPTPDAKMAAEIYHREHGDMDGTTCLLESCALHFPKLEGQDFVLHVSITVRERGDPMARKYRTLQNLSEAVGLSLSVGEESMRVRAEEMGLEVVDSDYHYEPAEEKK